jgi:dTDP-4-dehydrorhamnose reductase
MAQERWLVTGASGQLGGHVLRQLALEDGADDILALAGQGDVGTLGVKTQRVNLARGDTLCACVEAFRPTHVIHLGAMTAVADCYARPDEAYGVNATATQVLAEAAEDAQARLVFASTDMVFDGTAAPYRETDPPGPLSVYGMTKLAAERALADFDQALVVRLPLMYGLPCAARETTFVRQLAALRSGQPVRLFTDEFRTPVWLADVARAVIGLARSDLRGVIHVAGPERLSRYELVARCAKLLGVARPNLVPVSRLDIQAPEPRPADLSLDGSQFGSLFAHLMPGPIRPAVLEAQ